MKFEFHDRATLVIDAKLGMVEFYGPETQFSMRGPVQESKAELIALVLRPRIIELLSLSTEELKQLAFQQLKGPR